MKSQALILSLVSCSSFLTIIPLSSDRVVAQCVQADVAVQYNISGSKKPTERNNDVSMQSQPGCVGNSSVTTTVQGNMSGDRQVQQNRRIRHHQTNSNSQKNPTGINGETVQVQTNVGVDVYNPAEKLRH